LLALGDETPHDRRYARLIEYTSIIRALLQGGPVSLKGEFYAISNLRLSPGIEPGLMPRILLSGSSPEGLAAARALDALPVRYPAPPSQTESMPDDGDSEFGIRVGIIGREDEQDAWALAHERFPEDRRGQAIHQLAMKVSDSAWHRQLSAVAPHLTPESAYWMVPFQNYKTFCPYLVGSYSRVGDEIGRYLASGCRAIILDVPPSEAELQHTRLALAAAERVEVGR
ncbi:MAG TPA: LLM class flavin-dependent oxidoreductase, partial [Gemmatimonadales bacterium]|nr:LLM class flavin-dependent oxidoreductase [Gemmatimonadales bacterium]